MLVQVWLRFESKSSAECLKKSAPQTPENFRVVCKKDRGPDVVDGVREYKPEYQALGLRIFRCLHVINIRQGVPNRVLSR